MIPDTSMTFTVFNKLTGEKLVSGLPRSKTVEFLARTQGLSELQAHDIVSGATNQFYRVLGAMTTIALPEPEPFVMPTLPPPLPAKAAAIEAPTRPEEDDDWRGKEYYE